jgi:D-xylose transport system permease protein
LQKNLQDLPSVLLFGAGLGQQGGMAGNTAAATIGGGEGAIFSIAFQLGVPAALLFLLFLANLIMQLWRHYRTQGEPMALAATWLLLGVSTTLVSSEHMLSVSGSAALWLLSGAVLRSLNASRSELHQP